GQAVPGDGEVPDGVHGHGGVRLVGDGDGIDRELAALGHALGVVAPGEHSFAAAVLAVAGPGDDEVAGGVHGHGWQALVEGGIGVDLEFAALRRTLGVEALAEDPTAVAVLEQAGPDDHEVAVGVGSHGRLVLVEVGEGVHGEYRSVGSEGRHDPVFQG